VPVKVKPDDSQKGTETAVDPLSRGPMPVGKPQQNAAQNQSQPNQTSNTASANQQAGSKANGASSSTGGQGGTPGSAESGAGNPLPTSDFESYPVTHVASRFVSGRIEARTGRKMRTRQLPRLGVAAYADLAGMDNPSVVMMLKIDTTGNVVDVQIEHSSGSDDVDLPCQRAAYTWWFEPLKDPKTGTIRPEMIEFTIYF
jgi:TonB family protein